MIVSIVFIALSMFCLGGLCQEGQYCCPRISCPSGFSCINSRCTNTTNNLPGIGTGAGGNCVDQLNNCAQLINLCTLNNLFATTICQRTCGFCTNNGDTNNNQNNGFGGLGRNRNNRFGNFGGNNGVNRF